jgi:hypothetical protein
MSHESQKKSAAAFAEELLEDALKSRTVSPSVIRQRRHLFDLSLKNPRAVIAFRERGGTPKDPQQRMLMDMIYAIAARAAFEQGLTGLCAGPDLAASVAFEAIAS